METPEEILELALSTRDMSVVQRWWQAGGDMLGFLRAAQARMDTCTHVRELMTKAGLDKVYPVQPPRGE